MTSRTRLTIAERQEIVRKVSQGVQRKLIAKEYNINAASITNIIKRSQKLLDRVKQGIDLTRKSVLIGRHPELDRQLKEWIIMMKRGGKKVLPSEISIKAKQLADELGIVSFNASPGYIKSFKRRMKIESIETVDSIECKELSVSSVEQESESNHHKTQFSTQEHHGICCNECKPFYKTFHNREQTQINVCNLEYENYRKRQELDQMINWFNTIVTTYEIEKSKRRNITDYYDFSYQSYIYRTRKSILCKMAELNYRI